MLCKIVSSLHINGQLWCISSCVANIEGSGHHRLVTLVIFATTYSALGQRGCVEGREQRGQQEVGCWIYLPLPVWALSPYGLSPAGQQTSWQLGFEEGGREGNIEDSTEWNRVLSRQTIRSNVKDGEMYDARKVGCPVRRGTLGF